MFRYVSAFIGMLVVIIVATSIVIPVTLAAVGQIENTTTMSCTGMRTLSNPDSRINDLVGVLSPNERKDLAAFIGSAYANSCVDVGVIITNDTHGLDVFSYTTAAFDTAGLGGRNDTGMLMTISTKDKQYFIETGYGLEGCMPDGKVGEDARAKMFYPVLDDFTGRTGGGGAGGTMKASGYGRPIIETLGGLVDQCKLKQTALPNPEGSLSPDFAKAVKTVVNIMPMFVAVFILLMTVSMIGDPRI